MTASRKKLFVKTFGCQMNVYDSGRMADALGTVGFVTTEAPDDADLIILNTCHIREKAAEKVYSEVGRMRAVKHARGKDGRDTLIAVAGCVAQAEGEEIVRRAPVVDLVFGPQAYHRLPDLVDRAQSGEVVVDTDFPAEDKFDHLPAAEPGRVLAAGPAAFVTVQEGCDKFCAFCVVPYTRGAEMSRPAKAIIQEVRGLAAGGVREITLLGQNVNAWHGEAPNGGAWGLARLLGALAGVEGIERLRYTTSHPRDMDDELIAAHRELAELMPFLHLPVQSGSDRVLALMNRRHTRDDYLRLVERVRAARPDIAMSGDFIVGFPGESERDFEDTLSLVREVDYAQAFSFKYSPRPGTPAATIDEQVPEPVKAERLQRLQGLLADQQRAFNQSLIGREMSVLLERPGRKPGQLVGRSPYLQPVNVDMDARHRGEVVEVVIESAGPHSLFGRTARAGASAPDASPEVRP